MLKTWNILRAIFLISCFTICNAAHISNGTTYSDESQMKVSLVEDIIQKICNMSINTFANKNPEEKAVLLVTIEEKLNKSAHALGAYGTKYVNLIMKGVRAKAFEKSLGFNDKQTADNKHAVVDNKEMDKESEKKATPENITYLRTNTRSNSKDDMVENIANKIEALAKGPLKYAKTEEERQNVVNEIKKKVMKSASLYTKNDKMKTYYVDLVTRGIALVLERNALNGRIMEFAYTNNINLNKKSRDLVSDFIEPMNYTPHDYELGREVSKPKSVFLRYGTETTLKPLEPSCNSSLEEACHKIKMLKTLRCISDNTEFSILKLCDGVGDCLDFSDEYQCGQQAIQAIHTTNRIIADIDSIINVQHCSPDLFNKRKLSKQNKVLSSVLKHQLIFLEKYSAPDTLFRRVSNENSVVIDTIHESVNIVDSLLSALGLYICPELNKGKETKMDIEDAIKEIIKDDQEICKCNGRTCLQTCSTRCQSICLEKYSKIVSISQLSCDAVNGEGLVSLDMLCDGKLDCYDEIDEKSCSEDISLAKFEAAHMYDYILKEMELKTASIAIETLRSEMQSLYALVKKLQKYSLNRQPDVLEIKRIRQACFEQLSKVYDSAWISTKIEKNDLFNIRIYLETLNERLIGALKRSHTGNNKIISADGCVCRGNKCALPRCSKSCIRACKTEPQLTRFFCGKQSKNFNDSIPIELVCNKKVNCPNGEDEENCNQEVCRTHHLKLLRLKLRNVGEKYSGKSLGEALKSWRLKVTATLMVAENKDRPSPHELYDILHNILHDLVLTYAALDDRHDTELVFNEFHSWSRVIIDTLKSCSH